MISRQLGRPSKMAAPLLTRAATRLQRLTSTCPRSLAHCCRRQVHGRHPVCPGSPGSRNLSLCWCLHFPPKPPSPVQVSPLDFNPLASQRLLRSLLEAALSRRGRHQPPLADPFHGRVQEEVSSQRAHAPQSVEAYSQRAHAPQVERHRSCSQPHLARKLLCRLGCRKMFGRKHVPLRRRPMMATRAPIVRKAAKASRTFAPRVASALRGRLLRPLPSAVAGATRRRHLMLLQWLLTASDWDGAFRVSSYTSARKPSHIVSFHL